MEEHVHVGGSSNGLELWKDVGTWKPIAKCGEDGHGTIAPKQPSI